jgi:hypothetical protein
MIVKYTPKLDKKIRNIQNLPLGLKRNYLVCIKSHKDTLIAKQWKRKKPKTLAQDEILIVFS